MARDEVDPSLITDEPRKRKLPSYANNTDNISARGMEEKNLGHDVIFFE